MSRTSAAPLAPARRKYPDIECLRAIAIVTTLLQHAEVLLPWKDSA